MIGIIISVWIFASILSLAGLIFHELQCSKYVTKRDVSCFAEISLLVPIFGVTIGLLECGEYMFSKIFDKMLNKQENKDNIIIDRRK